jgi:CubicO group peptidase (beta-lactamase class C family)
VRRCIEASVERAEIPGAVVLVARGEQVEAVVAGRTELPRDSLDGAPLQRDAIFRIASLSKPIVALGALLLIEDGKLQLQQAIDEYLPELADRRVLRAVTAELDATTPALRSITVEDLLTLRLGVGIPPALSAHEPCPFARAVERLDLTTFGSPPRLVSYTADEWLRRVSTLPWLAQPGERWLYNTGSAVLGILISRVSGRPLSAFLRERVFEPLGMRDTGFCVPPSELSRLPAVYAVRQGQCALVEAAGAPERAHRPHFESADAGLLATADDCLAFANLLRRKGRLPSARQLLPATAITRMTANQLTPAQCQAAETLASAGLGWGYGLGVAIRPSAQGMSPGSYGWNGGRGTSLWVDPVRDLTVVVMTQRMFQSADPPDVHKQVWRALFGATQA